MSDRERHTTNGPAAPALTAHAVQQLGLARDLEWTLEEAAAIRDQLVATRAGLALAETRVDAGAEEPATTFQPGREA